jgi:hypothetical protein
MQTIPELSWMIVGERMNEGALLYVGIRDDIGPLSALTFRGIDLVFGRSERALEIFGLILFCFQIFYLNYIALKHKMYNENNYLPALFYGIFGLTFFNIMVLSPQMLGLTFVLLSLNSLFSHIETRNKSDGNLLNIGLYIGLASLFYQPYFIMIFVHFIGLIVFTHTVLRRYLLLVYGVTIPFLLAMSVYAWSGNTHDFFTNFLHAPLRIDAVKFLTYKSLAVVMGASVLLFLISALKILSGFGFTIFQVRIQKTMFFGAGVSLIIFILFDSKAGYGLILFFPWAAFFLSHFFISVRHGVKREISFIIYFVSVLVLYFGITFDMFNFDRLIDLNPMLIHKDQNVKKYENKKIMVLGYDISPYAFGKQATPYFNWDLSKNQLTQLEFYDNLEAIDKNFRSDLPDVIIDQIDLVPKLFSAIPLLGAEYKFAGNGIYERKILTEN